MKKIIYYKSRSVDSKYKTQINTDPEKIKRYGIVSCNCPGWIFHRHCWHSDQLRNRLLAKATA